MLLNNIRASFHAVVFSTFTVFTAKQASAYRAAFVKVFSAEVEAS